jgi:hypothetical protein
VVGCVLKLGWIGSCRKFIDPLPKKFACSGTMDMYTTFFLEPNTPYTLTENDDGTARVTANAPTTPKAVEVVVPCHGTLRVHMASGFFEFIPSATEAAAGAAAAAAEDEDTVVVPSDYRVLPGTFVVAEFQGDEAEANQSLFWVQGEQEDMDGVQEYTGFWLHTIPEIESTPSHVTIARNLCCKDSHHILGGFSDIYSAIPTSTVQYPCVQDGFALYRMAPSGNSRTRLYPMVGRHALHMHELDAEVVPPSPGTCPISWSYISALALAQVALFEDDASLDTPYMRALREATPFTSAADIRVFAAIEVVDTSSE